MESLIKQAKRSCLMCSSYREFRPRDNWKDKTLNSIKTLYSNFLGEFNQLRKEDAPIGMIRVAQENKTLCLDAISACEKCRKEFDKVNRMLNKISLPDEGNE